MKRTAIICGSKIAFTIVALLVLYWLIRLNFQNKYIPKKGSKKHETKGSLLFLTFNSPDHNIAYQIMQGTKIGGKDKILQLCLALSCYLEETNRFLTLSGNQTLYAKVQRDSLIIFALENHYSVMMTNELLEKFNQEIL